MSAFRVSGSHCKLARLRQGLLTSASRLALGTFVAAGITLPASAANFQVANELQLRSAISTAQNGDTIAFMTNIHRAHNLPLLTKAASRSTAATSPFTATTVSRLYVTSRVLSQSTISRSSNAVAQGGNGGSSATCRGCSTEVLGWRRRGRRRAWWRLVRRGVRQRHRDQRQLQAKQGHRRFRRRQIRDVIIGYPGGGGGGGLVRRWCWLAPLFRWSRRPRRRGQWRQRWYFPGRLRWIRRRRWRGRWRLQ